MLEPHRYEKRILVAVCGMSPQIVTETLYSLIVTAKTAFIPTQIHLITTISGAREAMLQLLHPKTGKFYQFCQDYNVPEIEFNQNNLHIIEDKNGLLDDIKTPEENEAAANFIVHVISQLTQDDQSALHVSIAGGRKTMGYYLGYALSLYGRPQDQLSHVLVTSKYESLRDFFYPTLESYVVYDRDNRALDAKDAEVMMANIPFVRMRAGIPNRLLLGQATFSQSVQFAQHLEQPALIKIDLVNRVLFACDMKIELSDINYSFYCWMIQKCLEGEIIHRMVQDREDYAKEFLTVYLSHFSFKDTTRTEDGLKHGMSSQWLSDRMTAIKKAFEETLGVLAAKPYIVQSAGKHNKKTYFLSFTPEQIIFS